jgi:thiopeptide-type bacteriocin biosynthesis protein
MNKPWISVHIFYNGNGNALLVNCVSKIVEQLRDENLIKQYFFIRYWQGGYHIRLRLLPAEGVAAQQVKDVTEPIIKGFMKSRPALFEVDHSVLKKHYRKMYEAEYGKEAFIEKYGEDGEIEIYETNSFHYIDYEPESERYGGPEGLELSEKHFEASSDMVLHIARETNVQMRSITLGRAIQIMLQMLYIFLEDDEAISAFLKRYIEFWSVIYDDNGENFKLFDRKYGQVTAKLHNRMAEIRQRLADGSPVPGLEVDHTWIAHLKGLKDDILKLYAANQVQLPPTMTVKGERAALSYLLHSYLHMTNNRLGPGIGEEVYMAHMIGRALEESHAPLLKEAKVG